MEGHLVVTDLDAAGVAAEDDQVQLGDVLAHMYGQPLRNFTLPLTVLRSRHEGQPIPLGVIKTHLPDGTLYAPLKRILLRHDCGHLLPKATTKMNSSCEHQLV